MQPSLRKVKEKAEKEKENETLQAEGKIGREEKERPSARGRERRAEMAPVIGEQRRLRSVWKVDVKYS